MTRCFGSGLEASGYGGLIAAGRAGSVRGRAMTRTSLPLRRREFITLIGGAAHPTILETAPH
jgi:hypothetical protein